MLDYLDGDPRNYDPNAYDPYVDPYVLPAAPPPVQLGSFGVPINNPGEPTQGLSYWQSRHDEGLPGAPSVSDIFDENGQLKPGWKRTANGYEMVAAPQTQYGNYDPVETTYGGWDGGMFGPPPQLRSLDSLWPTWNPPTFSRPPAFQYADFSRPSVEDAEKEPGYEFAATQGRKGVEATKAAQGIYRSGQTLKDIYAWASEFAKQNYAGVFDRALRVYDTNRNNAAENYMTNYGVGRDAFDRDYNSYLGGNASARQRAQLDFGRDWDLYQSDLDTKKFLVNSGND